MTKNWEKVASTVWPVLVRMAKDHSNPCSYDDLARKIKTTEAKLTCRNIYNALAPIQNHCLDKGYPLLTALVVRQVNGKPTIPGLGFAWGEYIDASDSEKKEYLKELHKEVYEFDWDGVDYSPTGKTGEVHLESFIEFARLLDGRQLKTPRQTKNLSLMLKGTRFSSPPNLQGKGDFLISRILTVISTSTMQDAGHQNNLFKMQTRKRIV